MESQPHYYPEVPLGPALLAPLQVRRVHRRVVALDPPPEVVRGQAEVGGRSSARELAVGPRHVHNGLWEGGSGPRLDLSCRAAAWLSFDRLRGRGQGRMRLRFEDTLWGGHSSMTSSHGLNACAMSALRLGGKGQPKV